MHYLFSDRLLRNFAGDQYRRRKRAESNDENQDPIASVEGIVEPDEPASEEAGAKILTEDNQVLTEEKQNKKKDADS